MLFPDAHRSAFSLTEIARQLVTHLRRGSFDHSDALWR